MKKGFLIVIISFLLLSFVNAQNYDNVKEMDLDFSIGSSLALITTGGNPSLERLEVFLKLYPREDFRQEIVNFKIKSVPEAKTEFNDVVYYKWNKLSSNYDYSINSNIKVKNSFNTIKSKINFPFTKELGLNKYLGETEFIDINDKIKDKTKEIIADETDYYTAVYKIGEWVRENIKYDLNTLTAETVQKSSWVFDNKEGVCDEMTNLFISMLRSVGIPARFVTGVVYANAVGGFGNHGWAEVYFPGIGWLPFGQYGWVDATHLKLAETSDSGESSVDYKWLSSNIEINPGKLKLKTEIEKQGEIYKELVKLSILPLNENFKFGSYLLVQVNVQNLQDNYLTTRVYLTKGPSQLEEGDNGKIALLRPKETKTLYWLMKIPSDLQQDLAYSSIIEVKETFGGKDIVAITYSNNGKYYSLRDLADIISGIEAGDKKGFFSELYIKCDEDNTYYKTGDNVDIKCEIKNTGLIKLENIKVCFNNDCSLENFNLNEEKKFVKKINVIDSVIVTAENNDLIRKTVVKFNYTKVPELLITEIRPEKVDYNVETEVIFSLSSSIKAYDIEIDINGYKPLYIDELDGEKEISLNINSKNLRNGLKMKIKYRDENNNEYEYDWNYPFIVNNVPWYISIFDKIGV